MITQKELNEFLKKDENYDFLKYLTYMEKLEYYLQNNFKKEQKIPKRPFLKIKE